VIERHLVQVILLHRGRLTIKPAISDSNRNHTAFRVSHRHNCLGKVLRGDAERFPLKPLILVKSQQQRGIILKRGTFFHSNNST